MTIQELVETVSSLSDMEDLNKVIQAVKIARTRSNSLTRMSFSVGQEVTFPDRKGRTIQGKIKKINRKNIVVSEHQGFTWNVAPSLLEKVN